MQIYIVCITLIFRNNWRVHYNHPQQNIINYFNDYYSDNNERLSYAEILKTINE